MGVIQKVQDFATPSIIGINLRIPDGRRRFRVSDEACEVSRLLKAQQEAHMSKDKALSVSLAEEIREHRFIAPITPSFRNARLFQQIIDHEKVHPLRDVQELRQKRLTKDYGDKDCQAIMVHTNTGRFILANIFRYHVTVQATDGVILPSDLPGNVDVMKSRTPNLLTGAENLTAYYSVSSVLPGAAKTLVGDLKTNRVEVTASPIRKFNEKYNRDDIMMMPDEAIRSVVLDYLERGEDPVQKFHMGNGAYVGWVHVNRDAPMGSPDWITVNYVYDREHLEEFQTLYRAGIVSISEALHENLNLARQRSKTLEMVGRPIKAPDLSLKAV